MTFFFFNDTATTEIYTLSLHDALPILATQSPSSTWFSMVQLTPTASLRRPSMASLITWVPSTASIPNSGLLRTWRSEEHTSELQSRQYLVCRLLLEKKNKYNTSTHKVT